MKIIESVSAMQQESDILRRKGRTIAFVPTMGYLHGGHTALIREARRRGDYLVVSVFVNPTQFSPGEDLDSYPRDIERDIRICQEEAVDTLFMPAREALFGQRFQTAVILEALPRHLCGRSRPNFFQGVATIVTKLFNIVKPHIAVFGEKDYQQLLVVRRLVRDLNFDIEIVGVPTVREADGLAMSSRNAYLTTAAQRRAALSLHRSLYYAAERVAGGETSAAAIIRACRQRIAAHPETDIDYIAICDPETLEDMTVIDRPVRMALAVTVGKARLIDNMRLTPGSSDD